jgi:hypothetical protein
MLCFKARQGAPFVTACDFTEHANKVKGFVVDLRNNPGALQGLLTRVLLQRVGADALARSGLLVNAIGFALVACLVFVPRIEYLLARLRVCSVPFLRRSPRATGRLRSRSR